MATHTQTTDTWLRTEYYRNLSKKENPHGFVCILCYKTHLPKDCQAQLANSTEKHSEEKSSAFEWLNHASDGEWYGD